MREYATEAGQYCILIAMFAVMPSCTFFLALGESSENRSKSNKSFWVLNLIFAVGSVILIAVLALISPLRLGYKIEVAGEAQRESFAKLYDFNACTDDQS